MILLVLMLVVVDSQERTACFSFVAINPYFRELFQVTVFSIYSVFLFGFSSSETPINHWFDFLFIPSILIIFSRIPFVYFFISF